MDLEITRTLKISEPELSWRFSRPSGPGGQHVNTSDSRVELFWSIETSRALNDHQRERLLESLGRRLIAGILTVSASEERSQLRNREVAMQKLADRVGASLASDGPHRRATKPTKGSQRRRLAAKSRRSETKQQRKRPPSE